ncbi:MAG: hypothetical protein OEV92_02485 [Nitrospinota bacterium]|nr:hypothetical protein [Nitrospinota bacterium]
MKITIGQLIPSIKQLTIQIITMRHTRLRSFLPIFFSLNLSFYRFLEAFWNAPYVDAELECGPKNNWRCWQYQGFERKRVFSKRKSRVVADFACDIGHIFKLGRQ